VEPEPDLPLPAGEPTQFSSNTLRRRDVLSQLPFAQVVNTQHHPSSDC